MPPTELPAGVHRIQWLLSPSVQPLSMPLLRRQASIEFNGCLALACSRCPCHFCGWCSVDCGTDAHAHVRQYPPGTPSNCNSHGRPAARPGLSRCRDISHHRTFPARCRCGEAVSFEFPLAQWRPLKCREIASTNCRCSWERATCDSVCFAMTQIANDRPASSTMAAAYLTREYLQLGRIFHLKLHVAE